MSNDILDRLKAKGVELPEAAAPAANYVPAVTAGSFLFTSGQLPLKDGSLVHSGIIGRDLDLEQGREAAQWCAINILAQAQAALGDLSRIKRIVKISVFVASAPDFIQQHLVANGASDFLADVLGDAGKHARSAVGMASLPLNAPVEIEAIIEIAG